MKHLIKEYTHLFHHHKLVVFINVVLVIIVVFLFSSLISSTKNDEKLKSLIEIQSTKITELASINKELHTTQKIADTKNEVNYEMLSSQLKDLLKNTSDVQSSNPAALSEVHMITIIGKNPVNIYSQNTLKSGIVTNLPAGKSFIYSEKKDGWYKIEIGTNQYGWIESQFVNEFTF